MPTPRRLAIKQALTTLLEGVNPTNTDPATSAAYTRDLRGKVLRGRMQFGDDVTGDFLAVLEAPKNEQPERGGRDGVDALVPWQLLVQGFTSRATSDPANGLHETDDADLFEAQVAQRLSRVTETTSGRGTHPEFRLGGLVASAEISWGTVRPADKEVSTRAYFYIPLLVRVHANPINPYV